MSLRGGVPTSTRCLTKVTLCGVLTHLPSLMSSELIHMGTTDGKHLVYQVEAVKSFGIHRRGQPLFTAGSPGIPLSPFSGCGGANGRKAAFPGTGVLAGNLRSHGTEGPRVLIKRTGLQLPASNRPFVQGMKWHLGPAITTTLSQRWLYGPCFLGHLSVEGKKDHRISRTQCGRASSGTLEKSLATRTGVSGLLGQLCFNKHQGLTLKIVLGVQN